MGVSVFGEFDPLAANDEGFRLVKQGRLDEGLALLADSARAGIPWALATYSWQHLIRGNPAEAIDLAQTALPACRAWIASIQVDPDLVESARYQVINARSNLALCGLALGYEPTEALAVWAEGVEVGHPESAFYPAIVAYRTGNSIAAKGAASALPEPVLAGLRASFLGDRVEASAWFADWCTDGLAVLDLIGFTPLAVSRFDVDRMRRLPDLRDSGVLSADDWETLRLVHQDDRAATERALRNLADSGRAVASPALMELGTLLIDIGHFLSPTYREGWELLIASLDAPFKDVVAVAAWNISAEFRRHGDDVSAEDFGQLALELGDATAFAHYMRVAQESGDMERARQLALRAEALGDASPAAGAARGVLALDAAATKDELVREWFTHAQGSLSADMVASATPIYAWRGDYNVDVASAAIATEYFDNCELSCYFDSVPGDCDECGRVSEKFVYVASGAGDGGYSAFELYSPSGETIGVFTAFMDAMAGRPFVGGVADLRDWLDSSAPLLLGTIDSRGLITVGDSAMSADGRDISVDFEVAPGAYAVVCWVGRAPSGEELLPVAFAAGTAALGDILGQASLRLPKDQRDRLIASMWGAPGRLVHALMADIRPQVLGNNVGTLENADPARAQSYALQWAERDDAQDIRSQVADQFGCGSLHVLESLETRGWFEPGLPWWRPEMARDPRDVWARVLEARDPNLPPTSEMCRGVVWVRRAAARHPLLRPSEAALLVHDPDRRVRLNLARNPITPPEILAELTESADVAVASAAASSEECPVDALVRLARAGRCDAAVASNPNTPLEIVEGLAGSASSYARASVAGRQGISVGTLVMLAGDPDQSVRAGVAGNPGIDAPTARQLAQDPDEWVRRSLAANPQVPGDVIAELTLDASDDIRKSAASNPNASEESRAQASLLGTPVLPRDGGLGASKGLGGSKGFGGTSGLGASKGLGGAKGLGASDPDASTPEAAFCTACGSPLVQDGRFCPGCGAPTA